MKANIVKLKPVCKTSLKKKTKLKINTSLENETKETNYKGSKTNNNTTNEN